MPKLSSVPQETWNLAMVLYAQGVKPEIISKKLSIPPSSLYKRIYKGGWANLLTESLKSMEKACNAVLQEADFRFRTALGNRFIHLSNALPRKELGSKQELELQRSLEPAMRNASTLFNWKEGNGKNTAIVRLNVLGSCTVSTTPLSETNVDRTVQVRSTEVVPLKVQDDVPDQS